MHHRYPAGFAAGALAGRDNRKLESPAHLRAGRRQDSRQDASVTFAGRNAGVTF